MFAGLKDALASVKPQLPDAELDKIISGVQEDLLTGRSKCK